MSVLKELVQFEGGASGRYIFQCPGCKCCHYFDTIKIEGGHLWKFNGNMNAPVVSPSISVKYGKDAKLVCHFHIGGPQGKSPGKIVYLTDCTHALAGQTIDMVEWDS